MRYGIRAGDLVPQLRVLVNFGSEIRNTKGQHLAQRLNDNRADIHVIRRASEVLQSHECDDVSDAAPVHASPGGMHIADKSCTNTSHYKRNNATDYRFFSQPKWQCLCIAHHKFSLTRTCACRETTQLREQYCFKIS